VGNGYGKYYGTKFADSTHTILMMPHAKMHVARHPGSYPQQLAHQQIIPSAYLLNLVSFLSDTGLCMIACFIPLTCLHDYTFGAM